MKRQPASTTGTTDKQYAVNVSNYQYTLLLEAEKTGGLTLQRVLEVKQTTGGSLVRRGLLAWREQVKRFTLTSDGLRLMELYKHAEVERKNAEGPLSKFIRGPEVRQARKQLHVVKKRARRAA